MWNIVKTLMRSLHYKMKIKLHPDKNYTFWYSLTRSRYYFKNVPKIPLTKCLISVLTNNNCLDTVFRGAWTLLCTHNLSLCKCSEPFCLWVSTVRLWGINCSWTEWIFYVCWSLVFLAGFAVYHKEKSYRKALVQRKVNVCHKRCIG